MTRAELADASDCLESAADACTDDAARDRLTDLAEQIASRATADRGPDHGRMARWQSALDEIRADASEDVAADIDEAKSLISEYREGVAGV